MAMLSLNDFAAAASLFPIKLYRMVSDVQCQCMSWGGEGEHLVLNTRVFEDELLQQTIARWKYQLKTTSTTSFIRQLHAYGFRKVIEGYGEPNNIRRYFHPYFHRQRPDLLMFMKRSIRSGSSKKHPLRIFEESNKQLLPQQVVNQPVVSHSQASSSTVSKPLAIEYGETSRSKSATPNKRRRKTQPKRHPSFEEECDWEEDVDMSPPSMVTRLKYRQNNLSKKYPDLAESNEFANSPVKIKEEIKDELADLQDYYCQTKTGDDQLPKPAETKTQCVKENNKEDAKCEEITATASNKTEVIPVVQTKKDNKKEANVNAMPVMYLNLVPGENTASDEPLDLSRPSSKSAGSSICTRAAAKLAKNQMTQQQQIMKPATMVKGNNRTIADNSVGNSILPIQPGAMNQPVSSTSIFGGNIGHSYQQVQQFPSGPRMTQPGLPLFPSANTRINVPPHTVLQPAYIAWPTRGIFCPQTKQWIQSRPTIIPLPFKSQQISPVKQNATNPRPGFPFIQPPWNRETAKFSSDMKDHPVIVEASSSGEEQTLLPGAIQKVKISHKN